MLRVDRPQIKYRTGKLEPFAEVLLGGAHSNFYGSACHNISGICGSILLTNNAFALAIGGGVDIAVSSRFAIGLVDADYELTRFGNDFTGGNNSQSPDRRACPVLETTFILRYPSQESALGPAQTSGLLRSPYLNSLFSRSTDLRRLVGGVALSIGICN